MIHNPPAKYSAEGTSAVINIITVKHTEPYLNANSKTSYSTYFLNNTSVSYNYSKNKLNALFSMNSDCGYTFNNNSFLTTYSDNSQINRSFFIKKKKRSLNSTLQLDYDINPSTFLGLIYRGNFSFPVSDNTNTFIHIGKPHSTGSVAKNKGDISRVNHSLSFNFNKKYEYTDISIGGDLLEFSNVIDNNLNIYTGNLNNSNRQYSEQKISNYTINIDLKTIIGKTSSLEYGGKILKNKTHNILDFYDKKNGNLSKVDNKSDVYSYDENIQAAYFSFSGVLYTKFNVRLGLRLEHTITEGISITSKDIVNRDYTNLFPNASISYKTPKNSTISLNYNKRLSRPSFSDLNPFKTYFSDSSYAEGNPFLNPSYTNNLELSYNLKSASLFNYLLKSPVKIVVTRLF